MRLFKLEMKRMIKSRRTFIMLSIALLLAVLMAFIPISFESINRPKEGGGYTELSGYAALKYKQQYYMSAYGEVSADDFGDALVKYQAVVSEYGDDIPLKVTIENLLAVRPLLKSITEVYANPKNGIPRALTDIDSEDVNANFYSLCHKHLGDVMALENENDPTIKDEALKIYSKVTMPFRYYPGFSKDAFDYTEFYIFFLTLICVAITAPSFASEYQNGSDNILRCTKFGRIRLALVRILAAYTVFIITFVIGMGVHLLILDSVFGRSTLLSSFQMLFSIISLPNLDLWETQIVIFFAGLLTMGVCVAFSFMISALCKEPISAMLISIISTIIPTFIAAGIGISWLTCVFPAAGIGLNNNFLYQMGDFHFLCLGNMRIWSPYAVIFFGIIELPVFLALTVFYYCKHQAN